MEPTPIEVEGLAAFQVRNAADSSEAVVVNIDVFLVAFSVKAVNDECGEDSRLLAERYVELILGLVREQGGSENFRVTVSQATRFVQAVGALAEAEKKKIFPEGEKYQDAPAGWDVSENTCSATSTAAAP